MNNGEFDYGEINLKLGQLCDDFVDFKQLMNRAIESINTKIAAVETTSTSREVFVKEVLTKLDVNSKIVAEMQQTLNGLRDWLTVGQHVVR